MNLDNVKRVARVLFPEAEIDLHRCGDGRLLARVIVHVDFDEAALRSAMDSNDVPAVLEAIAEPITERMSRAFRTLYERKGTKP